MKPARRRTLRTLADWLLAAAAVILTVVCLATMLARLTRAAETSAAKLTPSQFATVELGRTLFWEPRVSLYATTSCASCHDPLRYGTTDHRPLAVGLVGGRDQQGQATPQGLVGPRRSPPILNEGYFEFQTNHRKFLDLRADNLRVQCTMPMENPIEMGDQTDDQVAQRLGKLAGYQELCLAAFGSRRLTVDRMQRGLEAFIRCRLVAIETPLNDFLEGDGSGLTASARRGAALFRRDCISCHVPPLFTNGECYNTGLETRYAPQLAYEARQRGSRRAADLGLAKTTNDDADANKFKTPGLVAVKMRKYFGHHGQVTSIQAMIDHYAAGGYYLRAGKLRHDPSTDERVTKLFDPDTRKSVYSAEDKRDLYAAVVEGLTPSDYPSAADVGPPAEFP